MRKQVLVALGWLLASGTAAHAQCVGANGINTLDNCSWAVSPQANDEVLLYQPQQTPHTRKATVGQLLGASTSIPLLADNNLSDLANVATARSNLGLGTSALVNTGTGGATVPLLNTANTWSAPQSFTATVALGGTTVVSDPTIPAQVNAGSSTQAFFGADKSGGAGLMLGYNTSAGAYGGVGGLIRIVPSDPLRIIVNSNVQAANFDSTGNFNELVGMSSPTLSLTGAGTGLLVSHNATVNGTLTAGLYVAGTTAGVTCSGSPTSSFASVNGIITHC